MLALLTRLIICFVASAILAGCDANLKKMVVLQSLPEAIPSFQQKVETTFNSFAQRHGFSCRTGDSPPALKSCRAQGPRFLELHRSASSFTVSLDQPYPGGLTSKTPQGYLLASEDLESSFKREFGGAVVVVSK
jgi:hypothetical protein